MQNTKENQKVLKGAYFLFYSWKVLTLKYIKKKHQRYSLSRISALSGENRM